MENYNEKIRYIEFLKKERFLLDQISKEPLELFESFRLSCYRFNLKDQISYNRKSEYLFLIEDYLKENPSEYGGILFVRKFFNIFKKDIKDLEILEKEILEKETLDEAIQRLYTFCIDSDLKSKQFSDLIHQVASSCEWLKFDFQELCALNLDQFRDSIEKIFLDMQEYLNQS